MTDLSMIVKNGTINYNKSSKVLTYCFIDENANNVQHIVKLSSFHNIKVLTIHCEFNIEVSDSNTLLIDVYAGTREKFEALSSLLQEALTHAITSTTEVI